MQTHLECFKFQGQGFEPLQRQSSLLQYKAAGSDSAMPWFKADALQNTDVEKLWSQSAPRKKVLALVYSLSVGKFLL